MVITNFEVKKRQITKLDDQTIYTGEYNIDKFKFTFDDEWQGLNKTLVIMGYETYNVSLLNDECLIPVEFYQKKGNISIGVFGRDADTTILASNFMTIFIHNDAYKEGQTPANLPTQTQWDEYIEDINRRYNEIRYEVEHGALTGATYTPSITDGVLSWTNDRELPNPEPVDLKVIPIFTIRNGHLYYDTEVQ